MNDYPPSHQQPRMTIRFPDGMREELLALAQERNVSMNALVTGVLRQYVDGELLAAHALLKDPQVRGMLQAMMKASEGL